VTFTAWPRSRASAASGRTASFAVGSDEQLDALVWASGFTADNCRSQVECDGFNFAQADEQAVSADVCPRG
jgi:hypothetical protein